MTNTTGIFFSFSSQRDADYLLGEAISMGLDKVILAIGGNITIQESIPAVDSNQVVIRYEKDRLGKAESYNRALEDSHSDITYLVSGDVRFDPAIFSRLANYFKDDVGMVIPKIVPSLPETFAEKVGSILWVFHHITMERAYRESKFFCGGEFQAVKHPMPLFSPEIINDDEFLCHQVYQSGRKIIYASDIEVVNFMPKSMKALLRQRVRINFGHIQSKRINKWHSSISLRGFSEIEDSLHIFFTFLKRHKNQLFSFSVSFMIEILSIFMAKIQDERGKSYRYWPLQSREK